MQKAQSNIADKNINNWTSLNHISRSQEAEKRENWKVQIYEKGNLNLHSDSFQVEIFSLLAVFFPKISYSSYSTTNAKAKPSLDIFFWCFTHSYISNVIIIQELEKKLEFLIIYHSYKMVLYSIYINHILTGSTF